MTKTLRDYDRYCNYMKECGVKPLPFKEFVQIYIEIDGILKGDDHDVGNIHNFMSSIKSERRIHGGDRWILG